MIWERGLAVLAMVAARVVPMVALLPAFGAQALPMALRLGMGGALAAWFAVALSAEGALAAPAALGRGALDAADLVRLLLMGLGELAIGVALAWLAGLVFVAVDMAGRLADGARRADGAGLLAPLSPDPAEGSTPLSGLYALLAVVVFAEMGGPGHVLAALVRSYEVLPLAATPGADLSLRLLPLVARIMAGSIEVAVGLAAPVLVAVWLSDLVLALLTRLAVGLSGPVLLHSATAPLLGLAAVLLGLGVLRAGLEGWLSQIPALLLRTAEAWRGG